MFILLSLLAAFIATVVNFSDKAIVSKYILDYRAASIFSAIIGAVIAVLVLPFGHWGTLTSTDILLVISSGVMLYLSYYTYWRAMSLARSTVVVMLIQLAPVLTLILSAIFLQEYLTYPQLIGFVLIIISATAFSIEREQKWAGFAYGGVIFTMLVSDLFFAISAIIAKHTIEHTNVFTATAFEGFGVCTGGALACLTFKPIRDSFVENLRTVSALPLVFIFSVEAIWLCYRITSYAATALGPVALERALEGTRLFMAFVFGAVLSRLLPQIFGPERKSVTVVNVALAVILIIGIYLVP